MGGPGSGLGYRWNTKPMVEHYHSIDVQVWHRQGLLRPHVSFITLWRDKNGHETASVSVTSGHDRVELSYRYNGDPQRYHIDLTSTPCPYGSRAAMVRVPQHGMRETGRQALSPWPFLSLSGVSSANLCEPTGSSMLPGDEPSAQDSAEARGTPWLCLPLPSETEGHALADL
jgi:hypothetical protein